MDLNGNQIIAVDFDKTLSYAKWPEVGEPNTNLFRYLKAQKAAGARIILNSCRTGEALEKALQFCKDNGLEFDCVNENLPELIEAYGEDSRKISADYYIDDRAVSAEMLNKELAVRYGIQDILNKKDGMILR